MDCFTYSIFLFIFIVKGSYCQKYTQESLSGECGVSRFENETKKVRRDARARIGEFPWLARIGLNDKDTDVLFFYCAGSLIHPKFVLTAAHCGKFGELVRLGEYCLGKRVDCDCGDCAPPPQDIKIKKHIFANHCRVSNTNDISLLLLETPAKISEFVRPICVPKTRIPHRDIINQTATVAGWNVVYSGWGTLHGVNYTEFEDLRSEKSIVLDPGPCTDLQGRKLEASMLCVGYMNEVDNPCVADSGGPLITYTMHEGHRRAQIIGVASHDLLVCDKNSPVPVVYTDVSYFTTWILSSMNTAE